MSLFHEFGRGPHVWVGYHHTLHALKNFSVKKRFKKKKERNWYIPAANAAFTPFGLSSKTKQCSGSAGGSNLFAHTRLMSGNGFPRTTSGSECPVTM